MAITTAKSHRALLAALLAASLGCSSKPADPEQKLAEARKQLEEAQSKVAEAEQAVRKPEPEPQPAAATPPSDPKPSPVLTPKPKTPAAPPAPAPVTIPAGTAIAIRTAADVSTKTSESGAPFPATLARDLVVDGVVLAPKGSAVNAFVATSDPGGRVKGRASLSVGIRSIDAPSGPIAVTTGTHTVVAQSTVKKDAIRTGIMSGAGAAIGAIAGGGKGAAIGAGAGAAAGVGTAVATRGAAAEIPAESVISLKTTAPVTVRR